jgi:methylenetetrahydrofolate dehydrogenase (NADP+)/methenyltetrahydrofolate cyclohydrolase
MAEAKIIDGVTHARALRAEVAAAVARLKSEHGVTPGLAVVLVGEDPASRVYVRNKVRFAGEAGMASRDIRLPASASEAEVVGIVRTLNADPAVHGILVQMPLPHQIDVGRVIGAIDAAKDVDGFHDINAGRLLAGRAGLVPCTPSGIVLLLRATLGRLAGLDAVVVGRSNIVGKPMAILLLREDCTVTIAHSQTRDLPGICRRADILVAAVGQPEMVRGAWVKPGATVIDVGINRVLHEGRHRHTLVGDVAFGEARQIAGAITPVPGGVGPMTIACLLANTLRAAGTQHGLELRLGS